MSSPAEAGKWKVYERLQSLFRFKSLLYQCTKKKLKLTLQVTQFDGSSLVVGNEALGAQATSS